ncbi:hypothetical protein B0J17DRAFT_630670 [Rhizoctonia solani]|nr:hypothetical protein B0J17DRAFT_630670 [Rhizoctonia solani]
MRPSLSPTGPSQFLVFGFRQALEWGLSVIPRNLRAARLIETDRVMSRVIHSGYAPANHRAVFKTASLQSGTDNQTEGDEQPMHYLSPEPPSGAQEPLAHNSSSPSAHSDHLDDTGDSIAERTGPDGAQSEPTDDSDVATCATALDSRTGSTTHIIYIYELPQFSADASGARSGQAREARQSLAHLRQCEELVILIREGVELASTGWCDRLKNLCWASHHYASDLFIMLWRVAKLEAFI